MDQSYPPTIKDRAQRQSVASQTKLPDGESVTTLASRSSKLVSPLGKNYGIGEVLGLLGGSKATHYNRLNPQSPYYDPSYPKPIKNGRLSIYLASEVNAYLTGRVAARDKDP